MKCECECGKDALGKYTWGSIRMPSQNAELCEDHAKQLNDMLNAGLKTGDSWIIIEPIAEEQE